MRVLEGKHIVLGVTGSIAAYKAADLASKLVQAGAKVFVVMTPEATQFITPLTFHSLTGNPVLVDMFDPSSEMAIQHVALGQLADVVVVAPATAHIIAKIASGMADDMVSLTVLASRAPVIIAPAMDAAMFESSITQENLAKLVSRGFIQVGPGYGRLASGLEGRGRMEEVEKILGIIRKVLGRHGDFAGKKIVVTAGGTQEPVDPVRVLTNRSSGKMGYALAEAARDRGAEVVLISAPVALPDPAGVETIRITTAGEMREAVIRAVPGAHALIMAAAVADYRPKHPAPSKIKKGIPELVIELEKTPDILGEVRGGFVRVGFAAETENLEENALNKLREKDLDLIVANDVSSPDSGFGAETNRVTIIDRRGNIERLPLLTKLEVAHRVLDRVATILQERQA